MDTLTEYGEPGMHKRTIAVEGGPSCRYAGPSISDGVPAAAPRRGPPPWIGASLDVRDAIPRAQSRPPHGVGCHRNRKTIGQLMMNPVEPKGMPPGPVM